MITNQFPEIRDLAIIGDRRTAALITTAGSIVWYCPGQFDHPSLFAALLDPRGGAWTIDALNLKFQHRRYLDNSGILETTFQSSTGVLQVTDWMSIGKNMPRGICRQFSITPEPVTVTLQAAPDYARRSPILRAQHHAVQIDQHYFYASHPLKIHENQVQFSIPMGEAGWAALVDEPLETIQVEAWLQSTLSDWEQSTSHAVYRGPYECEVAASLRALRLLTFEATGGIIAAPTIALPEVIGGKRNYDYRYVWLRDAGMIVSALIRAGNDGIVVQRFLDFICQGDRPDSFPLYPFSSVRGQPISQQQTLTLSGYRDSQPVTIGNSAGHQLQIDAYGNVLLAATLIYRRFETRAHWALLEQIADFLADHWHEPDHGLWEEERQCQYTTSKVIAACGLEHIAEFAQTAVQAQHWRSAAQAIRAFVAKECLTSGGAYAVMPGSEAVDVSAALFPVWGYTEADAPEMLATIKALEQHYAVGKLYRRHLEEFDSQQEGAFLAGTLWLAAYWVMRRELQRVYEILDAVLEYANDLGLFSEEADPQTGQMLGNFPQTFVHAAFMGVVIRLKAALEEEI